MRMARVSSNNEEPTCQSSRLDADDFAASVSILSYATCCWPPALPLLAQSGRDAHRRQCLLLGQERTSTAPSALSFA
jgi:hypothetical protein